MLAVIRENLSNGKNMGHEKETVQELHVIARRSKNAAYDAGKMAEIITARFYMGRSRNASQVYCSLWVHGEGVYTSGHGVAGGYGYHKCSAALQAAITNAGIELWGNEYDGENENADDKEGGRRAYIGGCGDSAMRSALVAIARATGADCSEYLIV